MVCREWYAGTRLFQPGAGLFSGRFQNGDYETAKKVLDIPAQKGYLCAENMKRLRNAETLAMRDGCSVAQIAMRYVFSSHMNTFAIVSATNSERLRQIVQAALAPFTEEDVVYLENDA